MGCPTSGEESGKDVTACWVRRGRVALWCCLCRGGRCRVPNSEGTEGHLEELHVLCSSGSRLPLSSPATLQ